MVLGFMAKIVMFIEEFMGSIHPRHLKMSRRTYKRLYVLTKLQIWKEDFVMIRSVFKTELLHDSTE
jgi:hypothetical protein